MVGYDTSNLNPGFLILLLRCVAYKTEKYRAVNRTILSVVCIPAMEI
jgi:hypothetical protein